MKFLEISVSVEFSPQGLGLGCLVNACTNCIYDYIKAEIKYIVGTLILNTKYTENEKKETKMLLHDYTNTLELHLHSTRTDGFLQECLHTRSFNVLVPGILSVILV